MTLIELLISLAISAALMVGLAAAFQASSSAVEFNDSYFRCTQTARVALTQIVTEIRCADAVKVLPGCDGIQVIRPAAQLAPNEIYRQFSYDPAGKRITLRIVYAGNAVSAPYELASNISACTFGPADTGIDANNTPVAVRIPIRITCSAGGSAATLAGAATPRRAMRP